VITSEHISKAIGTWNNEDDKTWVNKAVICINNYGMESNFEKGVEYLCVREEINHTWFLVLDMNNEKILVPKMGFMLKG
jgi:hypothetical protein